MARNLALRLPLVNRRGMTGTVRHCGYRYFASQRGVGEDRPMMRRPMLAVCGSREATPEQLANAEAVSFHGLP